jgi:hypothetical protein
MSQSAPDNNTLKADMNLNRGHLETPDFADRVVELKYQHLMKEVPELASVESDLKMRDSAATKFDNVFSLPLKSIQEWLNDLNETKNQESSEYKSALSRRDRCVSRKKGEVIRRVDWTPTERFEYFFLMAGAFVLWLVGYLSMVQVVKGAAAASGESSLTAAAVWLLPLAGVTVLTILIKILLGTLNGTKIFTAALWVCIIAGLIASLTWLFEFSGFIQATTAPVAMPDIDGNVAPVAETASSGKNSMLYIIVSILGESLGAGACWAYASSLASSKTIYSQVDNPEWADADEEAKKHKSRVDLLSDQIITAEGLVESIKAKKTDFIEECSRAYRQKQSDRLAQEEKELLG